MEPLYITEILANPVGTDRGAEWVELCAGPTPVPLGRYGLLIGTRRLALTGSLPAGACSIARTGTAAIRNREADVVLMRDGRPVQTVRTAGDAPEGAGFQLTEAGSFWATSTPGIAQAVAPDVPPIPTLMHDTALSGIFGTAACTAGILTATAFIAFRHARDRHHQLP